MRAGLDIVIVNWNTGDHLRECLASILAAKRETFHLDRVVIVDNASADDSCDRLPHNALPLQVIHNKVNRGFAAACNQGALETNSSYILFLNPDTRLYPDTLSDTLAFMEHPTQATTGICGVKLLDEEANLASACSRFPTLTTFVYHMLGLSRLSPACFPPHMMHAKELQSSRYVDQVIGAYFLIRTSLFQLLGGFDERFFVYYEEVDLSLRARLLGFRSMYLSSVTAFHKGRVSSSQIPASTLFYSLSSRLKFASKHYPRWQYHALLVLTCTVELLGRLLLAAKNSSWSGVRSVLSAYARLLREDLLLHNWDSM